MDHSASSAPVVALLDGTLLPPGEPLLRPDDLGVLRGDGVFETTLVVDGVARDLNDHLARLGVSAGLTGLALPGPDAWRRGIEAVIDGWSGGRQMVARLVASRGPADGVPVCYVLGAELPAVSVRQRTEGIRVLALDRGFTAAEAEAAPWLLAGAKTLSYGVNMAALRFATEHNADDAIFVASDGAVLEAPTASVVIARDRTLLTPPVRGILAGITVRRLFRAAASAGQGGGSGRDWKTSTEILHVDDLHSADGVWLASSARLLAPVISIDGRTRSDGGLTAELHALLDVPSDSRP